MPAYNPALTYQNPGSYANFNPSQPSFGREESLYNYPPPQGMYDDDNESTVHLAGAAAPFGHQSQSSVALDRPGTAPPLNAYGTGAPGPRYDPHDVYQGRAATTSPDQSRRVPQQQSFASAGLAYDDAPDYYSNSNNYAAHPSHSQYASHSGEQGYGYGGRQNDGGAGGYAV